MNHILFAYPEVSPLFLNGGIGTFVFEASTLLAKSGRWEVDILTDATYVPGFTQEHFRKAEDVFSRFHVRLIDLNRDDRIPSGWRSADVIRADQYYRHVARLCQETRYDLIEFPDWRAPGFFVARDKRTTGSFQDTQIVTHCHSSTKNVWDWLNGYFQDRNDFYCHYMEEYVKKYADIVVSPSEFLLQPVRQTQNIFEKSLLRNGYPISPLQRSLQEKNRDVINVACISRLENRKGQDILALAIRRLSESKTFGEDVHFIFCGKDGMGTDADGKMSGSIHRILNGISNWEIISPKDRNDLIRWLTTEVDICVVPSRGDNYPNVVLEAARSGCFVIGADTGGIPEIFKDYGIDGALFPSGDHLVLEKEIRKAVQVIRSDPNRRLRIAEKFEEHRQRQEEHTLATYERMIELGNHSQALHFSEQAEPRVSVIIPFHNDHQYASDAIRSAFASDYHNIEVILVNDGSDNPKSLAFLREAAKEFPDLKIIHKSNGGLGDARNAGLKAATGEFIVPLDADNQLLPGMLRSCSRVLSTRKNLAYVTTYYECLSDDGSRLSWQFSPIAKPLGAVEPFLLLENSVGDALSMIRRSAVDEVGGYSTKIYCFEDWDLWLKFHEKGMEGDVIPEVHFIYRLHPDSMSRSLSASYGLRLHQALLREHPDSLKDQSLAISTLLLREYWQQWRGGSQNIEESPHPGRHLLDNIRRGIKDPIRAFRYLAKKLMKWIRRITEQFK